MKGNAVAEFFYFGQRVQCNGGGFSILAHQVERLVRIGAQQKARRSPAADARQFIIIGAADDAFRGHAHPDHLRGGNVRGGQAVHGCLPLTQ